LALPQTQQSPQKQDEEDLLPNRKCKFVCRRKKTHTHTYTHNFSLCQTNSLTHLHVASSESHKSNIRNLSLSLSLINMSKVNKELGNYLLVPFCSLLNTNSNCRKMASSFVCGNAYFGSYLPWFFPPNGLLALYCVYIHYRV
jgi:hypothetical protein